MKKIVVIIFMWCLTGICFAADESFTACEIEFGKSVYDQRGCVVCHHPTDDQRRDGLGPSWKVIAEAYKDKGDALTRFLKGDNKPIIDQTQFPMMHGQIILLKTCSDAELKALEKYIIKEMLKPHWK